MKSLVLVLAWLLSLSAAAQTVFRIDSLPPQGVLLDKGWKWHVGDNPDWAKPNFDDSKWEGIDPTKDIMDLRQLWKTDIGWFRLRFITDSLVAQKSLAMLVEQTGASQIFLNGQLIGRYGEINEDSRQVRAATPIDGSFIGLPIRKQGEQIVTIRFAIQKNLPYIIFAGRPNVTLSLRVLETQFTGSSLMQTHVVYFDFSRFGILLILSIIHLSLFLFNQSQRANFNFFLYLILYAISSLMIGLTYRHFDLAATKLSLLISVSLLNMLMQVFFLIAVYQIFNHKRGVLFWLIVIFSLIISPVLLFINYKHGFYLGYNISAFFIVFDTIRVTILAKRKKQRGTTIIAVGVVNYLIFLALFYLFVYRYIPGGPSWIYGNLAFNISFLSIPIAISIYLALESSFASRTLTVKLKEVEILSSEKQQILANQNEVLEAQVTERTAELELRNRELVVEAALEKVRGRTMAMQKSREVLDVANTLYEELQRLGFTYGACTIQIMDKTTGDMEHWVAGFDHLKYPQSYYVPYFSHPCYDAQLTALRNSEKYLVYELAGDEKKAYDAVMFTQSQYKNFPETEKTWMQSAESVNFSLAYMKHGALHWGPSPLTTHQADILQRFATVFEQAYTRFNDLKQAEAQTKEAQVEVALERVRSRTIAMQKSEELREVVATIYEQLQNLGFTYGALGIVIMDETSGDMDWWMAGFGKEKYPENYYIPYFDHPFYLAQLNAWKEEKKFVVLEVAGQQKKLYDEVIFSRTDFIRIPLEAQKIMSGFEKITFSNANMKHGALSWGINPLDGEHAQILQRFAVVFEQTYTRFLDLKLAEQLAQQAKLDLENLIVEKRRTEEALKELKATQAQLIQKEKMASLGELTAGIAHEIQNPLNFVNNFSEVSIELVAELEEAQQKPDRDLETELLVDLKQNLQKITHHGQRASSIVKGMLEHSRTSTGQRQPTDINAMVDEYLRLAYQGLRAKNNADLADRFNANLKTNFAPDLNPIEVVPQEIGRVLLNLFNNAFYAVHQKQKTAQADYQPTITVSTSQVDKQLEIRVSDNGTGIPETVKAKIFQPFFTTKPTGEGTGLGLSLSYDIVTKGHGGTLAVESTEGEGTLFTITLPITTK